MSLRFGPCEIDLERRIFCRDGEEIALEPQVFDLLVLFARNSGALLDRDALIEAVWGGRIVSDAAISSRINAVRRAIGDDGRRQEMLQTRPRLGFVFLPEVTDTDRATPMQATGSPALRIAQSPDGTHLAWASSGNGPPLIRAGHFLTHLERDWTSPVWRPLIDRLGRHHRLIRYDQRGTGLSGPAPSFDLEALVADLEAVADAADAPRFPIFAASQGVPVAVAFAARFPERVSKLVLYGGFVRGRLTSNAPADLARTEAMLTMIRAGWGDPASAFARAFATLYAPTATPEALADLVSMQQASASAETAADLRAAIDRIDISAELAKVNVPTLVLHMSGDAVHASEQARILAAGIAGAELRLLDSSNHILLPDDPAWSQALAAVDAFLSE